MTVPEWVTLGSPGRTGVVRAYEEVGPEGYGSACINASTANAVAASAMKSPLSDVGSLSLLSEEAGHPPLVWSWFRTNQARALLRFS